LPYGAEGVEPVPEEALPPQQTIELARRLLAEGRPFSAHQVLENPGKDCPLDERPLWQGLAQLCVGLTITSAATRPEPDACTPAAPSA
jgi:hypothetical protein